MVVTPSVVSLVTTSIRSVFLTVKHRIQKKLSFWPWAFWHYVHCTKTEQGTG